MAVPYRRTTSWVLKKIRSQFIAGVIMMVPVGITILILVWIFNIIDNLLQPVIEAVWHHHIPGVGFGVTLLLIYVIGAISSNFVGKRLVAWAESGLEKIPLVRNLYQLLKQVTNTISRPNYKTFLKVVLVDFPHEGMKAIGFVTNELTDAKTGEKLYNVFVPTSPNPTTGFLQILKEKDVVPTNIPVNEALKMLVTVGSISPKNLG